MTAIITGDIINSEEIKASEWIPVLKSFLAQKGSSPEAWEIYRGDEFQIRLQAEDALKTAIEIKAIIKSIKNLDVRMGIGLGDESFKAARVSESNGTAYQRSGRVFEGLKIRKLNLKIATGSKEYDLSLNLMLKLALDFMDNWSPVSAEIVTLVMRYPQASQSEIAEKLNIQQSAVSQRQKRARLDLIHELLNYYSHSLSTLTP
ncbi:MAG: SatD family protein [Flavobacteriaceae bacterium]